MKQDLLIEIVTEELPTAAVSQLPEAGKTLWQKILSEQGFNFSHIESFGTPRRMAWKIKDLDNKQQDKSIERKGPSLNQAKDQEGQWTKAALGFAASCGVDISALKIERKGKNDCLMYYGFEKGEELKTLLPKLFQEVMRALPIAKKMRWGNFEHPFVRPVNRILALYGDEIISLEFFGIKSDRLSDGHRVHHPEAVVINHVNDYESALEKAHIIANIAKRKQRIKEQVMLHAERLNAEAKLSESLLDEVTNLTEWPVAIVGQFEKRFLSVPQEVLITTMQDNQKTFAVLDKQGKILPYFIAIANLESKDPESVSAGNEKVIRPRFADAEFFWKQDLKHKLSDHLPRLEKVIYQEKLGSLADKSRRVLQLSLQLAPLFKVEPEKISLAASLAKCDLQSEMVMEFPELQGIMGKYYAKHEGLEEEIALSIEEQYHPLQAGGTLPTTATGSLLALAEKTDTLLGGFIIGAKPTGSKDPYALRRMAIHIIRLLTEKQIPLTLRDLLEHAANTFPEELQAENHIEDARHYILERLQAHYRELDIESSLYQAVRALDHDDLLDFSSRIQALSEFTKEDAGKSFLNSAKRIRNILRKNQSQGQGINEKWLQENAEKALWAHYQALKGNLIEALKTQNYRKAMQELTSLAPLLQEFFADVMVVSEDENLRNNRLALLEELQESFALFGELSLITLN